MWKGEDMCNDENTCSLFEGGYFFYYWLRFFRHQNFP
jgi:hypothetical protein